MTDIAARTLEAISTGYSALIISCVVGLGAYVRKLFTAQRLDRLADENSSRQRDERQEKAILAILHGRIYKDAKQSIERDCITEEELSNLEHYYKPYVAMGGNGLAKNYMERCRELPLRRECSDRRSCEGCDKSKDNFKGDK